MQNNEIRTSAIEAHYNVSGTRILRYSIEIWHEGLHEHKLITAPDQGILTNKVNATLQKWHEMNDRRLQKARIHASQNSARDLSIEAAATLDEINEILKQTLSIDDAIDWEKLKNFEPFPKKFPAKPTRISEESLPLEPKYITPSYTVFEKIFGFMKRKRDEICRERYEEELHQWRLVCDKICNSNSNRELEFSAQMLAHKKAVEQLENEKKAFLENQCIENGKIDALKSAYQRLEVDSVEQYYEMVLENSVYPIDVPKDYQLEYNPETRILVLEYFLPNIDAIPNIKDVKFNQSKRDLKYNYLSENQVQKIYDETLYMITLRTIHELFEADVANALDAISFNGWVRAINKSNGKEETTCIATVQTRKSTFLDIDLANVDPKACFKSIKGVCASKLHSITPVAPILQISRNDKRFVNSYEVAKNLNSSTNLATMDWEDFEHLIREIFTKEFQINGGEVKITQASRDGGVDAVAFDPDPIRGGKIVIQAKRYSNTVGVSAVRDLYGTVHNEGATKGILVTTADYGPDSYEFAKGKPITLLNGSNLLHLLEKHGHHAKIDLKEAKQIKV